jgi:hypothetical protein
LWHKNTPNIADLGILGECAGGGNCPVMKQFELETGRARSKRRRGTTENREKITLDASPGTISTRRTVFVALGACKYQILGQGNQSAGGSTFTLRALHAAHPVRLFVCHLCLFLPVVLAASGTPDAVSEEADWGVVGAGESVDVKAEAGSGPPFVVVMDGWVRDDGSRPKDMRESDMLSDPRLVWLL